MGGRGSGGRTGQYFTWNKKLFPGVGAGMKRAKSEADATSSGNDLKSLEKGDYHEFDTRASYSHGYDGDGREQEQWFRDNSNYMDLIDSMSSAQREAFYHYWSSGYFMDGQQYQGWDNMTHKEQELTRHYDKILDQSVLKKGVTVTRATTPELIFGAGHKHTTLEELKAAEGKIVTSKGSMSTGAAKEGLTIGARDKQVEYKIHIPAGAKGAGMWIADSRIHGWGREQLEFMTNRDTAYRVGKTVWDPKRKIFTTHIYFIGLQKHDYGKKGRP